ncbi:nuclear transport factor 2 family protein [Striga asiatica]|uniref:Nuclear transport factor 2 family protein n=1 Tax=Striga asiatica TaxID=4170 RepID=A0A5A7PJ57_STRAF|nr:nuclear transport factor 2 family protein [Striga asiatica]
MREPQQANAVAANIAKRAIEIVIVQVENNGRLDPEEGAGDLELSGHVRGPREEESVDEARHGSAHIGGFENGVPEGPGALVLYLGHMLLVVVLVHRRSRQRRGRRKGR